MLCRRYLLRISHNLLKYQEEQDDGKYRTGKVRNGFRKNTLVAGRGGISTTDKK